MKEDVTKLTEEKERQVNSVKEHLKSEEKLLQDLLAKKFQILQRTSVKKLCHHFQVLSQVGRIGFNSSILLLFHAYFFSVL